MGWRPNDSRHMLSTIQKNTHSVCYQFICLSEHLCLIVVFVHLFFPVHLKISSALKASKTPGHPPYSLMAEFISSAFL